LSALAGCLTSFGRLTALVVGGLRRSRGAAIMVGGRWPQPRKAINERKRKGLEMGALATSVALCSSVLYLISLCVVAVLCLVIGLRRPVDVKAEIKTPFVTLKLRVRTHDHQR
jgi:hypothetical protein